MNHIRVGSFQLSHTEWFMNEKRGVLLRMWAFLLDFLFLSLFFVPATFLYSGKWIMSPEDHLWVISDAICLVFLLCVFLYFICMESSFGYTVGKRLFGMRIVDNHGQRISFKQSTIRNLLRFVDGLPFFSLIGILLIYCSSDGQRFGDRIVRTYVIGKRE